MNSHTLEIPPLTARFVTALYDHAEQFGVQLNKAIADRLRSYYELLLRWNPRLHLVAPCSPEGFATRHALESLMLLPHLPANARVVDVGSGAGLPILPCLMARPDLRVTLVESSQKKAVFLRETLRHLQLAESARLIAGRFEDTAAPVADCVTCRALDRFTAMLPILIEWAPRKSVLLCFGNERLAKQVETYLPLTTVERIPQSKARFLIIAGKQ